MELAKSLDGDRDQLFGHHAPFGEGAGSVVDACERSICYRGSFLSPASGAFALLPTINSWRFSIHFHPRLNVRMWTLLAELYSVTRFIRYALRCCFGFTHSSYLGIAIFVDFFNY